MFHSFRTRAEARAVTEAPNGPHASWKSLLYRDHFNPLAERLFEVDSRRTRASERPITSCEVVDFPCGPILSHHASLQRFCDAVTGSTEPTLPDWESRSGKSGHRLLVLNIDVFDDVDCAVSFLQEYREIAPRTSVIIASSGFARDDFDSDRAVITDVSLRLPLSSRSLEAALGQVSRDRAAREQGISARSMCSRL